MILRPLNTQLAEKARVELNEDPKRIATDLEHIKNWLAKQPHLIARTDDQWLIIFLRGCKYSLERAKEKLDLYYSVRTIAPELCTMKYNDPLFDELLDLGAYIILPKSTSPVAPRSGIFRMGAYDPNRMNLVDVFTVLITLHKILMVDDDNAVICGIQWLVDFTGFNMAHFLQMSPIMVKKMVYQVQEAGPTRLKGIHYINISTVFQKLINLVKSCLNEKNRSRLFVHNNMDKIYEYFPKSILPEEYGGDAGTIREMTDSWKEKKNQFSSWLEEDEKYRTNESKRPGKPKTAESVFGIEGSFRQMGFD